MRQTARMAFIAEYRKETNTDMSLEVNGISKQYGNFTAPVSYTHLDVYKRQYPHCAYLSALQNRSVVHLSCISDKAHVLPPGIRLFP